MSHSGPGLEFGLGETADAIRETTARFAADKIAPLAARIDADNAFPRELWPQMGEHVGALAMSEAGAGTNEIRRFLIGRELIGT